MNRLRHGKSVHQLLSVKHLKKHGLIQILHASAEPSHIADERAKHDGIPMENQQFLVVGFHDSLYIA